LYPVAPPTFPQLRLIWAEEAAVAARLAGADGRAAAACVVALLTMLAA
jgi:hypothetical protein